MSTIERIIDRAIDELWGWSPRAVQYTPDQQANNVRGEIERNMRDVGIVADRLKVTVESDGGLSVDVKTKADGVVKRMEPARSEPRGARVGRHLNMQARSVAPDLDHVNVDEYGGES